MQHNIYYRTLTLTSRRPSLGRRSPARLQRNDRPGHDPPASASPASEFIHDGQRHDQPPTPPTQLVQIPLSHAHQPREPQLVDVMVQRPRTPAGRSDKLSVRCRTSEQLAQDRQARNMPGRRQRLCQARSPEMPFNLRCSPSANELLAGPCPRRPREARDLSPRFLAPSTCPSHHQKKRPVSIHRFSGADPPRKPRSPSLRSCPSSHTNTPFLPAPGAARTPILARRLALPRPPARGGLGGAGAPRCYYAIIMSSHVPTKRPRRPGVIAGRRAGSGF